MHVRLHQLTRASIAHAGILTLMVHIYWWHSCGSRHLLAFHFCRRQATYLFPSAHSDHAGCISLNSCHARLVENVNIARIIRVVFHKNIKHVVEYYIAVPIENTSTYCVTFVKSLLTTPVFTSSWIVKSFKCPRIISGFQSLPYQ